MPKLVTELPMSIGEYLNKVADGFNIISRGKGVEQNAYSSYDWYKKYSPSLKIAMEYAKHSRNLAELSKEFEDDELSALSAGAREEMEYWLDIANQEYKDELFRRKIEKAG